MASATSVDVPSIVWPGLWVAVIHLSAVQSCPRLTYLALRVSFILGGLFSWYFTQAGGVPILAAVSAMHRIFSSLGP